MKRTIAIKLDLFPDQTDALLELQAVFVAACNRTIDIALQEQEHNRVRLHHLSYYLLRTAFPKLGAQMCCNAIGKAAQALKVLKRYKKVLFRESGSVHFDKRTYSLKGNILSLFTLRKRICIKLEISSFHQKFLKEGKIKEAELVRKGKRWFFHLVLDLPDRPRMEPGKPMSVDLGENVLAATSTGKLFGGGCLRASRDQFLAHRKRLQRKGSQAAKAQLRHISGEERRHVRYVNHCVSKQIVQEAIEDGCREIVLEDLTNIRSRIKAGKKVRSRLHRWPFDELRCFIEYKAEAQGLQVIYVNPAYTSQTCSCCLNIGMRLKHRFSCSYCGSLQHSDLNASQNLLRLALSAEKATGDVNRRHVAAISGR